MTNHINKCLQYKLVVLGIVLVLGVAGAWLLQKSEPAVLSPVSVVLTKEPMQTTTAAVQHYLPSTKAKLHLPKAVEDNANKVVLTATDVPKSKHSSVVTTVLDVTSGEATQYVQNKPLPLLAGVSDGSFGMYLGLKNLVPAVRIQASQDLFAVKALSFGVQASVDVTQAGRADTFIGVGGRFDW